MMLRQHAPLDPELALGRVNVSPVPLPPVVTARRVEDAPPDTAAFVPVVR
jgi:hypothetical protein